MDYSWYKGTDLGENIVKLHEISQTFSNSIFVDLGVREGFSSGILCDRSKELNNKIYGVDIDFSLLKSNLVQGQNYEIIEGDSSTIGRDFEIPEGVDILFVDTLHVKEQVLCELYYWIDKLNTNSYIVFHDTHWSDGVQEKINGITWDRVDDAIVEFFELKELKSQKNKNIEVTCYPESYGMTFIKIKNKVNFKNNIKNWNAVFESRNKLISYYWNSGNVGNKIIDLEMKVNA
jgi:cephalosporin hydroxylase